MKHGWDDVDGDMFEFIFGESCNGNERLPGGEIGVPKKFKNENIR